MLSVRGPSCEAMSPAANAMQGDDRARIAEEDAMREESFTTRQRPRWNELEALLREAAGRRFRRLEIDRALQLARTYRAATTDLAIAQARGYDADLIAYLN